MPTETELINYWRDLAGTYEAQNKKLWACIEAGCPNCGTSLGPEADAARAEDEAIQAEYPSTGGE